MKDTVIVIAGPTASGKSGIGIELAKKINGVVISADSMQIYKKLDVGTAKVNKEETDGIEHLLIDICDIQEKFSVFDYQKACFDAIEKVLKQDKIPIIVGGTGLYINAVVNNMKFESIPADRMKEIDGKVKELTSGKNSEELYNLLLSMDKQAAENIEVGNNKRVIQAIRMNLAGIKKSDIDNKKDLWKKNESEYNFLTVFIDMPRDLLYDRINQRVDGMLDKGVLHETIMLYGMKEKEITACQAIGYKEFFPYIEGKSSLEECADTLKQKTRNYAKRQITWFKKLPDKFNIDGTKTKEEIVANILKEYYEKV